MDLIANTVEMLTTQVKGNLDKNMIERNVFRPNLQPQSLNKVVETTISMLKL